MNNPERQLQASFWLMIALQTITAIDMPGKGPRKMPAPRGYVAAVVLWAIYGLIADAGGERAAAAMAWLTVLTAAVMGTMGKTLTDFLGNVSNLFAVPKGGGNLAPGPPDTEKPQWA